MIFEDFFSNTFLEDPYFHYLCSITLNYWISFLFIGIYFRFIHFSQTDSKKTKIQLFLVILLLIIIINFIAFTQTIPNILQNLLSFDLVYIILLTFIGIFISLGLTVISLIFLHSVLLDLLARG